VAHGTRFLNLLEIDGLCKHFGGVVAVDECSLSVAAGSVTGLIGPNGSGKTTVFNLVTGLIPKDKGSVTFKSKVIDGLEPHRIYKLGIGRTFQLPRVFARLTALENMLVPLSGRGLRTLISRSAWKHEKSRAMATLEFLEIAHVAQSLAGTLSYGQRKLLELGTVMMAEPELVLLDEPAGGVNPALLDRIGQHIRDLNARGITFLLVEHNMGFVANLCTEAVVMDRGRPIATGKWKDISRNPAVLDAYLGA
jgi:ABC-type branched-subunit amino acid transport system ATPase component